VLGSPVLKKLDMIVEIPPEEVGDDLKLLKRMRTEI
jgi:hypothetical protein